jgi:restriction endonuclease S subunit
LEGLEISEITWGGLERTKRIDAEFFKKEHIQNESALDHFPVAAINQLANVSDGNHFSISNHFVDEGIPYFRGQDVTGVFFTEQATPIGITEEAYNDKHMRRSHLQRGDVLLSIVGTVGELSLVDSSQRATCSFKLAIFRPHSIAPEFLALFLKSQPGASQIERFRRGTVQTGFLLEDTDQIFVPQFSKRLTDSLIHKVKSSRSLLEQSKSLHQQAEQTLLTALGLEDWEPPTPLTYEANFKGVFSTERLDSQFFQEKYRALPEKLEEDFQLLTLESVCEVTKGRTVAYSESGTVKMIRSGDLADISDASAFLRASADEDIFYLEKGDVLISSIGFGSIGKVQVFDLDIPCGTVSEVTILRSKTINPYFLCAFLRSIAGQLQIEQWITGATGQLHLHARDVKKIKIAQLAENQQEEFEELHRQSRQKRQHSKALLERAKRAVEIAIERDEKTALAYLDEELIPRLFSPTRHYIDLATIQRTIEAEALTYEDSTIKTYLHQWQKEGKLHDAGRGWYSDLPSALSPNELAPPIPEIREHLETHFPHLDFTLWSTRQFTAFFHHLPGKHATFLMVDRDALEPIADSLREAGQNVIVHPLGETAKKFTLKSGHTLILRPRLSSDHTTPLASIEQTLVDLSHEIDKLALFDRSEYCRLFQNLASRYRLNVPALARYAERRKIDSDRLLKLGGIIL